MLDAVYEQRLHLGHVVLLLEISEVSRVRRLVGQENVKTERFILEKPANKSEATTAGKAKSA
jgi:hypothetical protein